ncbi:peptidylprolyl isomerase [uncultured Albimonas sp.]|uniref:peptidylprolyl isomerase n=1 Tax=uncultured Albimonas sp. TaxID=1331701 RepID=UPI0030EE992D|tara:strand:+ start:6780 stop:7811 length:1032 start_codon:yes stop_codon:yes gene_type:complete
MTMIYSGAMISSGALARARAPLVRSRARGPLVRSRARALLAGCLAALALLVAGAPTAKAQSAPDAFAAAAFVNGKAVTNFDVAQRQKLIGLVGAGADDRETALQSVIDDRLKRGAASAAGVQVPPEEIEAALGRFAGSMGVSGPAALESRLRQAGVSLPVAREFIETELLWSALVRRDFLPGVQVSEQEIDAQIEAMGLDKRVSYSMGEIAVPDQGDPVGKRDEVQQWVEELRAGADFEAMARARSRSRSAAQGGRIGWVPASELPGALSAILSQLPAGGVTDALTAQGAVVILKVFERREEPREMTPEDRERVRAQMLEQRLARQAEGRLQQLRARAYVERR